VASRSTASPFKAVYDPGTEILGVYVAPNVSGWYDNVLSLKTFVLRFGVKPSPP
jgi:hypothetical protein